MVALLPASLLHSSPLLALLQPPPGRDVPEVGGMAESGVVPHPPSAGSDVLIIRGTVARARGEVWPTRGITAAVCAPGAPHPGHHGTWRGPGCAYHTPGVHVYLPFISYNKMVGHAASFTLTYTCLLAQTQEVHSQ